MANFGLVIVFELVDQALYPARLREIVLSSTGFQRHSAPEDFGESVFLLLMLLRFWQLEFTTQTE